MNNNDTNFIFYIDNEVKRRYLKEDSKGISWSGFDFEAKRFNQYKIGLQEAVKLKVPIGYKLGYTKIETTKTYGWV